MSDSLEFSNRCHWAWPTSVTVSSRGSRNISVKRSNMLASQVRKMISATSLSENSFVRPATSSSTMVCGAEVSLRANANVVRSVGVKASSLAPIANSTSSETPNALSLVRA